MIKIEEQDLKEALTMALGSQGIWTPELASTMFIEIQKQALNIDDVSKYVLLAKSFYKAKDGTIKEGIPLNGKFYAPKNDC